MTKGSILVGFVNFCGVLGLAVSLVAGIIFVSALVFHCVNPCSSVSFTYKGSTYSVCQPSEDCR